MSIEKKPFRLYDNIPKEKPLSLKLNDKDKEMLEIGMYMLNMHSKSGVLKELAHTGLKVLLQDFGMERMHYFTSGERTRLIRDKPRVDHFRKMVD